MIELRRILCPIDFSDHAARALRRARTLADWYGAELCLLHVYHVLPVSPLAPEMEPAGLLTDEYRTQLTREVVGFSESQGPFRRPPLTRVVEGTPAACILDAAREWPADLIVLGTHGRSGLPRLVLGSVAERVLRQAPCPVLTVPAHAPEPADRPTFKRIVCATDFSAHASRALEYAASLAQEADAVLTVAHIFELQGALPEHWRTVLTPPAVQEELRTLEAERQERLEHAVPAAVRTYCTVETAMRGGTPYREILRLAAEREADLIVLGVHGRNPADVLFFGSTANHVVRAAECPVLTIRS
jgi:nucleotide-binding universal stress UspA family protein